MAKGQVRKNKEARKPKKEKPKTIAANPPRRGRGRSVRAAISRSCDPFVAPSLGSSVASHFSNPLRRR